MAATYKKSKSAKLAKTQLQDATIDLGEEVVSHRDFIMPFFPLSVKDDHPKLFIDDTAEERL